VPTDSAADRKHVPPDALIIAADGGAEYCRKLDLVPDVIVGDMDSLERDSATIAAFKDTEIIRHPTRKDATDLELAIRLALARGAQSLIILGALGGRWDMSIGNLFLLALPELAKISVRLVDGPQEIVWLTGKKTAVFHGDQGDTLSLIPTCANVSGITLEGLEYPLEKATLAYGTSRGISNVLKSKRASVALDSGTLVCILIHKSQPTGS
ncbi:MAG: thiamine diphosphokinase, partial [Desulfobacterales bacterium]|nr:thiamine diphosphokinase [Desulfobacterales bacterium]